MIRYSNKGNTSDQEGRSAMALTEEEKKEHAREAKKKYNQRTKYASQKKYQRENKEAIQKKSVEYAKAKTKLVTIRFQLGDEQGEGKNDRDVAIWDHLETKENKSGYVKDLIAKDAGIPD